MCGIIGVVGRRRCQKRVMQALKSLEYRGYDSAGIACLDELTGSIESARAVGPIDALQAVLQKVDVDGFVGIAHTRWATHGGVTVDNAHPHKNCRGTVAVVHNGIIEQAQSERNRLTGEGHCFVSETDTEIAAHLFSQLVTQYGSPLPALCELMQRLRGSFAFVFVHAEYPEQLFFCVDARHFWWDLESRVA